MDSLLSGKESGRATRKTKGAPQETATKRDLADAEERLGERLDEINERISKGDERISRIEVSSGNTLQAVTTLVAQRAASNDSAKGRYVTIVLWVLGILIALSVWVYGAVR